MAKKRGRKPSIRATSFRIPAEYMAKLDHIVEREKKRTGYRINRTDILKKLIDSEEFVFQASREGSEP